MSATHSPAEAFSPGEYLRDELEERGWTATEFAQIIDRPIQAVSEILNGKKEITAETAVAFSEALGTSAELWLNLQNAFKLHQVRNRSTELSPVARRSRLRDFGPIAEMQRRGWLTPGSDLDQLEEEVKALFGLESLEDQVDLAFAARRSNEGQDPTPGQVAWLAHVKRRAVGRQIGPLDLDRLGALAAATPRELRDGPAGIPLLARDLADCGVVLVFEGGLAGSKLDGAVVFGDEGTAVVGVTGRYDRFDGFMFTFLHELAHLVLRHIEPGADVLVDENLDDTSPSSAVEASANAQALEWMFPGGFTPPDGAVGAASVARVATTFGVHPSLVIGQLHRRGLLDWSRLRSHIPKVRPFLEEVR